MVGVANSSRFLAIETALKAVIDAGTDATVTVTRGHPGENLTREACWVGDMRFGEAAAALSPLSPRRQTITWDIIVRVAQQGDDFPTLRDRAYTIADQAEKALHADLGLGNAADFGQVTSGGLETWMEGDARVAAVLLETTYVARRD